MIVKSGPNKVRISFVDWTSGMMLLSSKYHTLAKPDGDTAHEIGIDRLNNWPLGPEAIDALFFLSDDLKVCPNHKEVLRLGKAVIRMMIAVDVLLVKRKRIHIGALERRRKRPAKIVPIRPTGKIVYRRGN